MRGCLSKDTLCRAVPGPVGHGLHANTKMPRRPGSQPHRWSVTGQAMNKAPRLLVVIFSNGAFRSTNMGWTESLESPS